MGKIKVMPDSLASQVAAGEVVERPASVVKELVENSLDAEARRIEVRTARGGIALIQVVDDGVGMSRDDALMCLERHATSKIHSVEDLDGIRSLGFRGEALPSIASVSKFRLTTRQRDALSGTEVVMHGGKLGNVRDCGEAPGTMVEVRSLFFNIPARRKFLRTESTEYSHLEQQVRIQAIAHPEVGFSLVHNDRPQWQLPAESTLLERIRGLAGAEVADRLLEIREMERNDVRVHGYMGGFGMGRSNRSLQLLFLNGRPVEASVLNYALREGFHTVLMKGQYPVIFLFLEMSPFGVDVNVHPAKKEVRFRNGTAVKEAVVEAISATLTREQTTLPGQRVRPSPPITVRSPDRLPRPPQPASSSAQMSLIPEPEQRALRKDWSEMTPSKPAPRNEKPEDSTEVPSPSKPPVEATAPARAPSPEQEQSPAEEDRQAVRAEDFRFIGVLGKLYVLLESREGLVLMDQHAAHERILFERMRARMANEGVPAQKLLVPITMELPPNDFAFLRQNLDAIQRLGIGLEPFGTNTVKIDALPQFFQADDPANYLSSLVEELKSASRRTSSMRLGEDMVATTVCRHAVKANDHLREPELGQLLKDLLSCELPYCCPHGRPTLIQISYDELERKFGRQV